MPEIFSNTTNLTASFGNFSISWDLGIIAFLFIAGFLYAFSIGQKKFVFLLISSYVGFILVRLIPYLDDFTKDLSDMQIFGVKGGVFLALTIFVFFFSSGSIFRLSFKSSRGDKASIWQQAMLSLSAVGFIVSSSLALLPDSYYNNLSTITREGFVLNNAHFWWALFSVVVLLLLKKRD